MMYTQALPVALCRRVIEWLAWQHQEIVSLVENTPLLYTHAEELDNNEQDEISKVLEFLEIQGHHHVSDGVMTAKVSLSACYRIFGRHHCVIPSEHVVPQLLEAWPGSI